MTVHVGQDDGEPGAPWALYSEVLARYIRVLSTVGDCALARTLEAALDSRDGGRLAESLRRCAAQPAALRGRIRSGTPSLARLLDSLGREQDAAHPTA